METANQNTQAGDTVYLRGGTYNTAINPSNSGTSDSRIIFQAYGGEAPIITNTSPIGPYKFGVALKGISYIKIDGITFVDPLDRPLELTWGASYNEISNCTFEATGVWRIWDGYPAIDQGIPCKHNWIHHNIIAKTGVISDECDDWNGAKIGVPAYDNRSGNNTIEYNEFYCGGHHNLETYTKYNVIRNNIFHNEGCMTAPNPPCPREPDSNGLYGNRNIQIYDGHNSSGMFNLLENNRIGHAGRPPDDDGAHNLVLTSRRNIVRHNYIFNAASDGLYFKQGWLADSDDNMVYRNTIYHNGHDGSGYSVHRRNGITIVQESTDNIIKNNIIYDNYNKDYSDWGMIDNIIASNWLSADGDPAFTNPDLSDPMSTTLPDLSLQPDSPAIDSGTYLTQVSASDSGTGTTLLVDDALYFQDGTWGSALSDVQPDWIAVGTVDNAVQISSINYDTNTIILANPINRNPGDPVWLYKDSSGRRVLYGSAPDVGAFEYVPALCQGFIRLNSTHIRACSCNQTDVQAAIDAANDGDVIKLPAGNCTWTSSLKLNKSIRLHGAGIDKTILRNGIINTGAGDYVIKIAPSIPADNPYVEITGFTIDANSEGGCISIACKDGTYAYSNFRIHHNNLKNTLDEGDSYMCIRVKGNCFGLIDRNIFENNQYTFKIYGNDDNSWKRFPGKDNIGTENYLYIESNNITGAQGLYTAILTSGEGARWVFRYNTVDTTNTEMLWDAHGDTRNRGVVAHEIYENTINNYEDPVTGTGGGHDYRGGTGIIFNNNITCGTSGVRCKIQVREEHDSCTNPTGCDGSPCGDEVNNGYMWNNRNSRDNKILAVWESDTYSCINEDDDWWDDASSSPGGEVTPNFFYDIAANRLITCTDDDVYWETDTRKLYRCERASNWEFVYQPYIYPHPLTLAPFGTEICGEGEITSPCWCEGSMRTSGECNHGYYSAGAQCVHKADSNCDGKVNVQELINFIKKWKKGEVTIRDVIEAIKKWKNG